MRRAEQGRTHQPPSTLEIFYAVTISPSLYILVNRTWGEGWPLVARAPQSGQSSLILEDGRTVGITRDRGIWLVNVASDRSFWDMPWPTYWGGHTNKVVALFLELDEAMACLKEGSKQTWDNRWHQQSQEVLEHIGDQHPLFKFEPSILAHIGAVDQVHS